jgi:hypothetical protein
MLGVFFFYAVLFESFFDRKLTVNTSFIVPRLYVDNSYLTLKNTNFFLKKKQNIIINKLINKNNINKYF